MKGSIRQRGTNRWEIVLDNGYKANHLRRQVHRSIHGGTLRIKNQQIAPHARAAEEKTK